MIGKTISQYSIVEQLGAGGMADVALLGLLGKVRKLPD